MRKSRFTESQIVSMFKELKAAVKAPALCRRHGISGPTLCNWRSKYAGLEVSVADNRKRIGRIYRAADPQVRKRVRRKLALGRGPITEPVRMPNKRWSLVFVHDRLRSNRRFRILVIGDDCTREILALESDFAFSGERMTRVLDAIAELRSLPKTIVLDNAPEMCPLTVLRWTADRRVRLHHIVPGKPAKRSILHRVRH